MRLREVMCTGDTSSWVGRTDQAVPDAEADLWAASRVASNRIGVWLGSNPVTADHSAFIVIFTARPEGGDWFCPEFLAHAGREDQYVRIPIPPEFALIEAADQRASVSAALVAVIEHASSLTQEQRESLHSAASVLPWGFEWTSRGRVIGNLGRGRYEVTIDVVGNLSITAVLDDGTRLPNYIRPYNGFGMDLLAAIDRGPFEPVFRKPEAQWSRNPRRDATAHAEEATGSLTLPEFEAVIVAWQEGPAAGEGIPDPHPAFAAHFTNPIYSDFGDEQAPFGSDEGFDALFAAAKGCEGAGADLTVRDLLEIDVVDVEEFVMGAARGSDLHQILIATGLGLIRATGRIDVEGRNWLLRALRADEEATIDDTWDDVIHSDLSTYPPV